MTPSPLLDPDPSRAGAPPSVDDPVVSSEDPCSSPFTGGPVAVRADPAPSVLSRADPAPFLVDPPLAPETTIPAGALAPYFEDPRVTDLFINGARGLFVDRGSGAEPEPGWRASERERRELATALIALGGRHIDESTPCVDVRLSDGTRIHAVLPPLATDGTTVSVRVPRVRAPDLATLAGTGTFDRDMELWLRGVVQRRANFLVTGSTGSGKTTLLAGMLAEAPPHERIVTIEDVAELRIRHPHHVALEARQANLEGAGAVGLARLVREALRMKPDRLVLGECRGEEVRELLTALNTGHDGGAGTVHANGLDDVPARMEALGALAGLDRTALARQVVSAMDLVIHVERDREGTRAIAAIGRFEERHGQLGIRRLA